MFAVGRTIGTVLAAAALASTAAAQETKLETRLGGENFVSPPASLDQMDWLVGQWEGEGIQGAPAMESWLPPSGGVMVGTFVQTTGANPDDQAIMFTEHLYLMEEEGSLVLRLKHFNADLTGWEEKDDMLTFRLVAMEPCAAYFNALTLRCADPAKPGDGLVAAVRMKSDRAEPQELLFHFKRSASPERPTSYASSCADAYTTLAMNECLAGLLEQSDARRAQYLASAIERYADREELVTKISGSDAAFVAYRDAECGAVYEDWKEGSIRGVMSLTCQIDMTDKRTLTVWKNWLTYPDSTPPILPKPGSAR